MGICANKQNKQQNNLENLDHLNSPPFTPESQNIPLAPPFSPDDELPPSLPNPLPSMTPRLSRQSAFSRASIDRPGFGFNGLPLPLTDALSLDFDDEDDTFSIVSPSIGQGPFTYEYDPADDEFVQKSLKKRKYTEFLLDSKQKKTLATFSCTYCGDILQDPVILVPCGHEFCRGCFYKWRKHFHDQPNVPCPSCSTTVHNQWHTPAIRSKTYMNQKRFKCSCVFAPLCDSHISIGKLKKHIATCIHGIVTIRIRTLIGSKKSIKIEIRKSAKARDCINEIMKHHDEFDISQSLYLYIDEPGSIVGDDSIVRDFFLKKLWIGRGLKTPDGDVSEPSERAQSY